MSDPVKHTCIGGVYPHPKCQACVLDAQRQCGYWISTTTERCGQCERCKREPQPAPQEPSADIQQPSECVSYCRHDADTTKARCAWCKPTVWQEPLADTIQAVRELYRDDRDAMAAALLRLRAEDK